MQQLTGIFDSTWLGNKRDAFLSSAKFVEIVGIPSETACQQNVHKLVLLYEKGVDFVTKWIELP